MKIDRLISIIMVLLEREKISATLLAEMFEVTPRTIYRDIETIAQAGIPVVSYPGVNGGISIMEKYKVDKKLFTQGDIATLLMGLGSISPTLSSKELVGTLAKVKSLIPEKLYRDIEIKSNQISIDLTTWSGNRHLQPNLEIIKQALNESRCLSFHYSDSNGISTHRSIEPYQLVLKQGHWYIQGYCFIRQAFRLFKLYRMSQLTLLNERFIPREFNSAPLNCSEWIDPRLIDITLLIDASLRERIAEHCGEENIQPTDSNKLMVRFPFVADEQGYNILLSFGNKCECLAPEHVRRELIQRVQELLAIYQS
ncbi:helix-turn-helix transcriptional regulator [Pragia fontium]|uniref:helix-turn-helix transcriptional regulator n=1 Tax=Pragia fontium TaxID=82985 RepID=UPI00064A8DFC|nr:YafY family protein [Pragia fontium]AKJ42344.1 transcriptional regulator [Pragia fontium]